MPRKSPRGHKVGMPKKRIRKTKQVESAPPFETCGKERDIFISGGGTLLREDILHFPELLNQTTQSYTQSLPADPLAIQHDHTYAKFHREDVCDFFNPDENEGNQADCDEPCENYLILPGKTLKCDSDGDIPGFDWFTYLKDSVCKNNDFVSRYGFTVANTSQTIQIIKVYDTIYSGVQMSFVIDKQLNVHYYVHNKMLPSNCSIELPKRVNTLLDIECILYKLSNCTVCEGNHDDKFNELCKKTNFLSNDPLGYYREGFCGGSYKSTIRSSKCQMVFVARNDACKRCANCILHRGSLRKLQCRVAKSVPLDRLRMHRKPHSSMTKSELAQKLKCEKQHRLKVESKLESTKKLVSKLIDKQGENLTLSDNDDILAMTIEFDQQIEKCYHKDSFEYIFWNEQKKYNTSKSKNGMRWHPLIIKWCLQLQNVSSKAYNALQKSGFIHLPSSRTLFDYSHVLPSKSGFDAQIIADLVKEASAKGMYPKNQGEEWKSFVGILQDEIKIKQDLVYDKSTGELIGYIDLDKLGNTLSEYERLTLENDRTMAKYMLVIMVRGANSDLKYPLASFATDCITSGLLYPIIWQAIEILEIDCNLKVIFITCDGASPNRKFFQLHKLQNDQFVYFTDNPFSTDDRKIFFISDVPHLIKTTRNCFANSYSHSKSRKMWKDGKDIKWTHIVRLYEECIETSVYSKAYKITREHIDLTAFNQMKVRLAAQVLSCTVANALESTYGDPCSETVKFIKHMNRFFDCLNVRSLEEGHRKRLADMKPYKLNDPNTDMRLDYLLNDFLGYFNDWENSVNTRPGDFSKSERSEMMLSYQTRQGLTMTTKSCVALIKFMLNAGTPFVLSHNFNQDPLEELFGHCRHKGGSNRDPTVYDVNNALNVNRLTKSEILKPVNGNITSRKKEGVRYATEFDCLPMAKRKR